ncbi:MAG: hypothetical protein AAF805_15565 [Planctomycetota bacterium]
MPDVPLPPLKTDPCYGHFPWWPEDGDAWVHPEDVTLARQLIPGPRVWRRDGYVPNAQAGTVNEVTVLHYGDTRLRVRRSLWRVIDPPAWEIGDWVEVRPRGLTNEPHTGVVRDVHWDDRAGDVRYYLTLADGTPLERAYEAIDFKPVEPPDTRPMSRLEPSGDADDPPGILPI